MPGIQQVLSSVHWRNGSQTQHGMHGRVVDYLLIAAQHTLTHVVLLQALRKGLSKSDSVSEEESVVRERLAGVPKGEVSAWVWLRSRYPGSLLKREVPGYQVSGPCPFCLSSCSHSVALRPWRGWTCSCPLRLLCLCSQYVLRSCPCPPYSLLLDATLGFPQKALG